VFEATIVSEEAFECFMVFFCFIARGPLRNTSSDSIIRQQTAMMVTRCAVFRESGFQIALRETLIQKRRESDTVLVGYCCTIVGHGEISGQKHVFGLPYNQEIPV